MTTTFDPQQYKATTRDQWEAAAEAWYRWGPFIETWLDQATKRMLDTAGLTAGSRVLDVAAGAGGQSLAAARRVGPTGHVLATDISTAILRFAEKTAADAGITNITTRGLDGEHLDVNNSSFDAVICRVGLIYFPDQRAALAGIHAALHPGGRLSAVVYSTADRNEFFSIPVEIIRRRAQLPPPAPGQPGPFSFGTRGVAEQALAAAGFQDIAVETVASPVRMASAAECLRFERESFGALHQMMSGLSEADQDATWAEIGQVLTRFEGPNGFVGPCEMLVISATKAGAR